MRLYKRHVQDTRNHYVFVYGHTAFGGLCAALRYFLILQPFINLRKTVPREFSSLQIVHICSNYLHFGQLNSLLTAVGADEVGNRVLYCSLG